MGETELARAAPRWPVRLAALALAVGLVFSFPHWVWVFTSPDYSVLRGYILSDDDFAPYAAALSDASSHPLPPVTAYHRSYETRDKFLPAILSNWLTNLIWGNVLRLAGSLELFVPLALFVSGAATFLALVALARRFVPAPTGALLIAAFALFRYPFYISLLAAGRRLLIGGADPAAWLRAAFPGMVNGFMLYPYVRWSVPGLVFWWFLLALVLLAGLVGRGWREADAPLSRWAIVGAGVWIGLSAYVYFFFWSYLGVFLGLLIVTTWLMGRRRLAGALLAVGVIALAVSVPFWLTAGGLVRLSGPVTSVRPAGLSFSVAALDLASSTQPPIEALFIALSTHGLLALAVLLSPGLGLATGGSAAPAQGWTRTFLFCLHLAVVLLAAVEASGYRALQAWHWSRHMLDCLAPLTTGWLIASRLNAKGTPAPLARWTFGVAGLSVGLAAFVAVAGASQPTAAGGPEAVARTLAALAILVPGLLILHALPNRWPGLLAALALTAVVWFLYHRTVSEMSWLAFVPLGIWAAGHRPRAVLRTAVIFVGLNVALGLTLQLAVRPIFARPFFSQPPEISAALRWLDDNTPVESVVTTDSWLGDSLIRAYTHNLTLAVPGWWTSVRADEWVARLWVRAAIYGVPPEALSAVDAGRREIVREFKAKVGDEWIGDERLGFLTEQQAAFPYLPAAYANLYARPFEELLSVYRVDYIWVGPWEASVGRRDFDSMSALTLVYEDEEVRIYAVNRDILP